MNLTRIGVGVLFLGLVGILMLSGAGGCRRPPKTKGTDAHDRDNSLQAGLEVFRKTTNSAGFQEGLNQINAQLGADRSALELNAAAREVLTKHFALDADELKLIEATSFQQLNAHHLVHCCLLRDGASPLDVTGLAPVYQAVLCLDRVSRQVLLHYPSDALLPPVVVLLLGAGSARERALIFLELVQQFQAENRTI